jgi:hypothetical protein
MDDFRIGSISPNTPYGQDPSKTAGRKKDKRPKDPSPEQTEDDVVRISGQADDAEAVEDYYTPSQHNEEPE